MTNSPSGLQTLHDIDRAIAKARGAVNEVSVLPTRASDALAAVRRKQAEAYAQIAKDRLDLIEEGGGGTLGYVDRQAEKLLAAHAEEETRIAARIEDSLAAIESLETERRAAETQVLSAVTAYDKAAALAEAKILKDADYQAKIETVATLEATVARAEQKLTLAREDETEKGQPYRKDAFFAYLQNRDYGTKSAKGWFLTKALDHWVARICGYRQAAENYRRLTAIPVRLASHVENLEVQTLDAQTALQTLEHDMLREEGVTAAHEASLAAQDALEAIDAKTELAEKSHHDLRSEQTRITTGESGPYRDAIAVLSETLTRKDLPSLRRIAAQTQTRDDDAAIEDLRELEDTAEDLRGDQLEAKTLVKKYQKTLSELEAVRRRFKSKRFDAPSSVFDSGDLLGALLGQVVTGVLSGDDFWRQLQRAQKTVRRYSDTDFGGVDWTEGLRLPTSTGGSWGGGGGRAQRSRTSIPRSPRQSLPRSRPSRSRSSGGSSGGGFRTGGGF